MAELRLVESYNKKQKREEKKLKLGINFNLLYHSEQGDLFQVRDAIKKGADVNAKGKYGHHHTTPLIEAAFKGHIDIVKFLIKKGADITATNGINCTAHGMAKLNYNEDVMQLIEKAALSKKAQRLLNKFNAEKKVNSNMPKNVITLCQKTLLNQNHIYPINWGMIGVAT